MSQQIIKSEISEALKKAGYKQSKSNIDYIYAKHLGDSSDYPYATLIALHSFKLEK